MTVSHITVTPLEAKELIEDCLFNPTERVVPILKGSPGTAKSSIYRLIAQEHNLKFIDIRLAQTDPVELN